MGHCGTLDPFATGLLILVSGKNTKRAMEFTKLDKVYEATLHLGQTSTTGDPEGDIADVSDREPDLDEIKSVLQQLTGKIEQTPPAFSAIKINGQRAYKLARAGKEVEMPSREVEIYNIEMLDYTYPELKIRTHVSSGTYIRSLAADIGQVLGVGAYLTALRRTKIADFDIKDAEPLDKFDKTGVVR